MVNLVSGSYNAAIPADTMTAESELMTQNGFIQGFGGFGGAFLSISLTAFAITTIVGWYFFAESNIKLLAGDRKFAVSGFKVVSLGFLVVGTLVGSKIVWLLADLFM